MKEQDFRKTISKVLEQPKKKFTQRIELIISLKDVNLKKPEERIDDYIVLPFGTGRKQTFCALVGKELITNAKKNTDYQILQEDFVEAAKNVREVKKMVRKYDYFLAQANIMPLIAKNFGKYLGTKGKMPNPKMGQILPPTADLKPVVERLNKTVLLKAKNQPNIHVPIGIETMNIDEIAANGYTVYERILRTLPNGKQQIRHVFIKKTMSKPVKVGGA